MRRPLVIYDFATAPVWISFFISVRYLCTKIKETGGLFFLNRAAGSRVRREAAHPPPNLDAAPVLLPPNLDAATVFPSPNPGAKSDDSPPPICRPTSSDDVSCLGQPALDVKLQVSFSSFKNVFGFFIFMYDIQHCFICRPSGYTVSEDAGIEPRTVAVRRSI